MKLNVFFKDLIVGTVALFADSRMHFDYSADWVRGTKAFPISQSLPLSGNYTRGREDHRFFANLLPEAGAREAVCRNLSISVENDYELLKAIGGECAGALRILPEAQFETLSESYEPISPEILKKAIVSRLSSERLTMAGRLRLSLAGAQDKWPVLYDKGTLYWPKGGAPSSHILKFANPDFKGLVWNEAYVSFIASQLGLPVVEATPNQGYTLIKRYDREYGGVSELTRLHQEDFCQALGYSSFAKYEAEGGPDFAACIELVRKVSSSPAEDTLSLFRWQLFNLLSGNADGHAKNIAILYGKEGPRLAPFYDLVCTRVYPGISRNLAFSFGGNFDPGQISGRDFIALSEVLGINPKLIFRTLEALLQTVDGSLDFWRLSFIESYGDNPILVRINRTIRDQARRTRALLTASPY